MIADDRKQTTLHFHGRVDVTAGFELPGSFIVSPAYAKDDASTADPGMMISPSALVSLSQASAPEIHRDHLRSQTATF